MELPQHIADMCGIVSAKTQSQVPTEEFQAVTKDIEADGIFRISYRGELVGWIGESKTCQSPKFRALTVNGRINHCYTASQAMTWLLEEAF